MQYTFSPVRNLSIRAHNLFLIYIAMGFQQFRAEHGAACRPSDRIMGESREFVVIHSVLPKPSHADAHALLKIHIQRNLGTVIFLQVLDKLLRRTGQLQTLGLSAELP